MTPHDAHDKVDDAVANLAYHLGKTTSPAAVLRVTAIVLRLAAGMLEVAAQMADRQSPQCVIRSGTMRGRIRPLLDAAKWIDLDAADIENQRLGTKENTHV